MGKERFSPHLPFNRSNIWAQQKYFSKEKHFSKYSVTVKFIVHRDYICKIQKKRGAWHLCVIGNSPNTDNKSSVSLIKLSAFPQSVFSLCLSNVRVHIFYLRKSINLLLQKKAHFKCSIQRGTIWSSNLPASAPQKEWTRNVPEELMRWFRSSCMQGRKMMPWRCAHHSFLL